MQRYLLGDWIFHPIRDGRSIFLDLVLQLQYWACADRLPLLSSVSLKNLLYYVLCKYFFTT